jgi:flagellar biosynthesis protein FlhB
MGVVSPNPSVDQPKWTSAGKKSNHPDARFITFMADDNDQEKTEEPSARKLEKAREDGNVSISKDLSSVLILGFSVMVFINTGPMMYNSTKSLIEYFFRNATGLPENQDQARDFLQHALFEGLLMITPLLVILVGASLLVNFAQTQGMFSAKALEFKPEKLSPLKGLKKMVSMRSLVELIKGFTKMGIVGTVMWMTVRNDSEYFLQYVLLPFQQGLGEMGGYILMFMNRILAALFLLAAADVAYQRFQHSKDLRMTKQEIKDEYKQMEGDPHIKNKRRQFGLNLRYKKRLDHAILSSDVVVTNPTHFAIALKYDPDKNDAPIVMAKGQRLKALRIRELANKYGIPIVENKPIAQALYATAEEDQYIPGDLFRAVAEILAYVYKMKNKTSYKA